MTKNDSLYWDGYFMALAKISAMRSKDPSTKVGACIVNSQKIVVALGYNGMPKGNDDEFPWDRDGENKDTKYAYVIHAEINAVLNASQSLQGCTLYTSLFPCSNCAKTIVQAGINKIVYQNDKYHDLEDYHISRKILNISNVKFEQIAIDTHVKVEVGKQEFNS